MQLPLSYRECKWHREGSRKKHGLTLLEVMIALSLATVLFSVLITSYCQICKKRILAQELKKNHLSVELMRQKLTHLFARAAAVDTVRFYTATHPDAKGPCLIFTFDNGIDIHPPFCGELTGMLYHNSNHQICFASWAKSQATRLEILLEQVEEISFSFFDVKRKQWRSAWEKEDFLPPFFTLSWCSGDPVQETERCAFFFPQDLPIVYETKVSSP